MAWCAVLLFMIFTATQCTAAEDDKKNLKSAVDNVRTVLESIKAERRETGYNVMQPNNDVRSDNVGKRGDQILGLGGSCGRYNEKCSAFTTHCCDPFSCYYKKWYHRISKTGGRCM